MARGHEVEPLVTDAKRARISYAPVRRTNMEGILAFAPPPAGFDPIKARLTTLQRHGLPMRPGRSWDKRSASSWERLVPTLLETRFIHPEFEVRPGTLHPSRRIERATDNASAGTTVWGGCLVGGGQGATHASSAWGTLNIPQV